MRATVRYKWTVPNLSDVNAITLKNVKRVPNLRELVAVGQIVGDNIRVDYTGRVAEVISYVGNNIDWDEEFLVILTDN